MTIKKIFLLGVISIPSYAKDDSYIPNEVDKKPVLPKAWSFSLKNTLNGTMNDNRRVVGKSEGVSTTVGLKIDAAGNYRYENHQWRNGLNLLSTFTRTPLIKRYLKTEDSLALDSLYQFHLDSIDYLGPFVRMNAQTALMDGYDTQVNDIAYVINKQDGTSQQTSTDRIKLTDAFNPLRLKESFGLFIDAYDQPYAKFEIRTGVGFRQLYAKNQLILNDNSETDAIEVDEISGYRKAGFEVSSQLSGHDETKTVNYIVTGDMLIPFIDSNDSSDKTNFEKRIIELEGKVSFNLKKWASLDLVTKYLRDPDIIEKGQVSNSLMLSFNHTFTSSVSADEGQ